MRGTGGQPYRIRVGRRWLAPSEYRSSGLVCRGRAGESRPANGRYSCRRAVLIARSPDQCPCVEFGKFLTVLAKSWSGSGPTLVVRYAHAQTMLVLILVIVIVVLHFQRVMPDVPLGFDAGPTDFVTVRAFDLQ
jgi:hypothetical protein